MNNNPVSKTVKRELSKFLNKSFFFSQSDNNYAEEIILAAKAYTYVETAEGKSDSLHLKIKQCDWENLLGVYREIIKPYLRRLNIKRGIIALDITPEPFYGKTTGFYTIGCKGENGYTHEFQFLVLSLIDEKKEEKIPLACIPVHYGFDCANAIKDLLAYANKLFTIRFVLLDREFYSAENINALSGFRYLMLVPKLSREIKQLSEVVKYGYMDYKLRDHKGEEASTRIVLVRDKSDKFTWSFATNMVCEDYHAYVKFYKRRWRIETNFRVDDEAKIKSKSVFSVIRYFYFLMSLLLRAIWLVFRREIPFKRFLIQTHKCMLLERFGIYQMTTC
ncbi:MAG: transposase [Candidatus Aenigmarchaeota archaeon]|nr:transposase [Candidatus Aenigmarchaeota archaeon]